MDTIDLTPKWEAIAPFLLRVIEEGQSYGVGPIGTDSTEVKLELIKMAKLADKWVEHETRKEAETPSTGFRADMNIFAAKEELEEKYIQEAFRQVGDGHGSQCKAARLLGFKNYQTFVHRLKKIEKRKCLRGKK